MRLTRVFLKRPTLTFVFVTLTLLAGLYALDTLVVQQQPNTGQPTIVVQVAYNGASTSELETEVAEPIEDQIAGTPDLDHIDTTIETGNVSIAAAFNLNSSNTENIANIEKALQAAERQLPSTITPPTIRVADPSEPNVVTLALHSTKYSQPMLGALANNQIVPAIEQLPGVAQANVYGTTQAAYEVLVDPALLNAYNLTLTDVLDAITPNNVRAPGGIIYQPTRETEVDVRGDIFSPQSLADLPIHVAYSGTSTGTPETGGSTTSSGAASGTTGAGTSAAGSSTTSGGSGAAAFNTAGTSASGVTAPNVSPPPLPDGNAAAAGPLPSPALRGLASGAGAGTSGTGSTATTTAGGAFYASGSTTAGGAGTTSATTTLPIDTPVNVSSVSASNPNAITSNTTASSSQEAATMPSVSSSEIGNAAGTSLSPFVGILSPWAVPSADKRISDVAQVLDGSVVQRVYSTTNGVPGVGLAVQKASTASEVTVANEVIHNLPQLRAEFPGVDFEVANDQATFTEQQLQSVEHTLVEGIILTAVVMLFFLASWRNAVVVMVAIPTSLGVTLFVMKLLGLTLDTISLMAMTLVIGILIDDSTVVLENIERHRDTGEEPVDAALNGRSEIGMAAIVITMVDVVVFLPIAFAGGQVGVQLSEFGIVVSVATLTSLFVSFTVTPVLAGLWALRSTWRPWRVIGWFDERFTALRRAYSERWLPRVMDRPWPVVIVALVLCILSFLLVPTGMLGEEYQPVPDQGIIYVQVTLPPGHPLSQTRVLVQKLEQKALAVLKGPDYAFDMAIAGGYAAEFGGFIQEGNVGQLSIYLSTNHKTPTATWVTRLQQALVPIAPAGAVNIVQATQQGGGNQQPIDELVGTVNGTDPTPYAAKVYQALVRTPGAIGVQSSSTNAAPQVEVQFNRVKLQAMDVAVGDAASAVEAAFGGDEATQIETSTVGLTQILVEYPMPDQNSLAALLNIPIRSQNGGIVHLGDVAHLEWKPTPLILTRENREDVVHVSANVAPGYNLSDVTKAFLENVAALHLPKTVTVHPAAQGQQDLMNQALRTLGSSLLLSILLVFFMIVVLYNSYRTPFVTLFAIPLATIGAFGALWITRQTLNLYSLIGMVLLVGLVTKNGILLVDFADNARLKDPDRAAAMRQAAAIRFRPVIMTTVAMIAGMLPLALGLEPGGQSRASLAIAVIGGLTSSLVLTLFIVPIMYCWLAPEHLKEQVTFADERPPQAPPGSSPAPA